MLALSHITARVLIKNTIFTYKTLKWNEHISCCHLTSHVPDGNIRTQRFKPLTFSLVCVQLLRMKVMSFRKNIVAAYDSDKSLEKHFKGIGNQLFGYHENWRGGGHSEATGNMPGSGSQSKSTSQKQFADVKTIVWEYVSFNFGNFCSLVKTLKQNYSLRQLRKNS